MKFRRRDGRDSMTPYYPFPALATARLQEEFRAGAGAG